MTASEPQPLHDEHHGDRASQLARLGTLLDRTGSQGLAALRDAEVAELGRLYRAAATRLALERSFGSSARELERLNRLVARGHAMLYGRPPRASRTEGLLAELHRVPSAVRRSWRWHGVALVLLLIGFGYGFLGAGLDPEWALGVMPAGDDRTPYASREELHQSLLAGRGEAAREAGAEAEMRQSVKAVFAAALWRHNTTVALLALFAGFLAGVPTVLLILLNGAVLGVYSRTFHDHDLVLEWWAWILPHGVTELLAILLLSGGGLWIGSMMVAPGEHGRAELLRAARGDLTRLLLLAFPMLLLAAGLEAFLRQSSLGDSGRLWFAAASVLVWGVVFWLLPAPPPAAPQGGASLVERAVLLPEEAELLRALES